jgi:AcrR family transcriptional regulator
MDRTSQATRATRQRGEATRQQLLDEATRQFADAGFNGASLSAIATACGLGNAGVLHHFPSKERLYKAVLERISKWLVEDADAALGGLRAPAERLRAMIRRTVAGIAASPGVERLILRELLDNVGRVEHARSLPLMPFVTTFRSLVEEAQRAGAAPPGPPMVLLTQFLGALSYALVVRPTFARMEPGCDLLHHEGRWIDAVGAAAERALLTDRPDAGQRPRRHRSRS